MGPRRMRPRRPRRSVLNCSSVRFHVWLVNLKLEHWVLAMYLGIYDRKAHGITWFDSMEDDHSARASDEFAGKYETFLEANEMSPREDGEPVFVRGGGSAQQDGGWCCGVYVMEN